jgi:hypothetical protein
MTLKNKKVIELHTEKISRKLYKSFVTAIVMPPATQRRSGKRLNVQ